MSGFFSPEVVEVQGEMDCGVHCLFFERIMLFSDHDTALQNICRMHGKKNREIFAKFRAFRGAAKFLYFVQKKSLHLNFQSRKATEICLV
jgi:hypothetical protein